MRRFLLTYQREGEPFIEIEGVQFSDGRVVLDCYPDNEWPGTREFRDFASMEFTINEFGDTSVEWLDEEVKAMSEDVQVVVGAVNAIELKPDKRYMFVLKGVGFEQAQHILAAFKAHGIQGIGLMLEDGQELEVIEVPEAQA